MTRSLVFAMLLVLTLPALATTTYVSQSGGTFSGGSACNGQSAISAATFNGGTETAGNTYELCGTISAAISVASATITVDYQCTQTP